MIDKQRIVDIYNNLNIHSWTTGKNVTKGWVNISCPFCDDGSNHCGVNPATELFNCWKCGRKGHFVDLLIELTGLSFGECKDIISDATVTFKERPLDKIRNTLEGEISESKLNVNSTVILPRSFELVTNSTHFPLLDSYLERRGIQISTVISNFCGVCWAGQYMNRMIIPVHCQEKLVSFQAVDLSGFAQLRYRSAPLSMGRINDFLYNYDGIKIGGRMIITEGVLDAWRTGVDAVAAFTSTLTKNQKKLILAKNLEELYFCFDTELTSYYKSRELAKGFEAYIPKVVVARLPYGEDPDSYGKDHGKEALLELIKGVDEL